MMLSETLSLQALNCLYNPLTLDFASSRSYLALTAHCLLWLLVTMSPMFMTPDSLDVGPFMTSIMLMELKAMWKTLHMGFQRLNGMRILSLVLA